MLNALINNRLDAAERQLGVPVDYLREMYRDARGAFFKFAKFPAIAGYRKKLPKEAHAVGALVASRSADCGPCLQIGVNLARKEGVSPDIIRAVLERRPEDLDPPLADIYHFASSVVNEVPADEETLRARIIERFGKEASIELALVLATARVFPNLKRAMGHAISCSKVEIKM
jgi:alkylhydroperoxidase family enzyme